MPRTQLARLLKEIYFVIEESIQKNISVDQVIQGYYERAKQFLQQLEQLLPGITAKWNGKVSCDYWMENPFTIGSYSYRKVGQYTKFAGIEREREGRLGNCHFAGHSGDHSYS